MRDGPVFTDGELEAIARQLGVPDRELRDEEIQHAAAVRVRDGARSGLESGARVTPAFFIAGGLGGSDPLVGAAGIP